MPKSLIVMDFQVFILKYWMQSCPELSRVAGQFALWVQHTHQQPELGLDPLRDDALTVFAMAGGVCGSGVLPLDHYYYYYYEQLSEKFHVMIW